MLFGRIQNKVRLKGLFCILYQIGAGVSNSDILLPDSSKPGTPQLQNRQRLVDGGLQTGCIFTAGSGIKWLSAAAALYFAACLAYNSGITYRQIILVQY